MREIKFRLVQNDKIVGYERHRLTYVGGDKTIYIAIEHSPDGVGFCDVLRTDVKWHWIKHSKKEQYTGLLDKEGVEIYEGDIVEYFQFSPCCSKCANRDKRTNEIKFNSLGVTLSSYRVIDPTSDISELEVIGNIHQHPELME